MWRHELSCQGVIRRQAAEPQDGTRATCGRTSCCVIHMHLHGGVRDSFACCIHPAAPNHLHIPLTNGLLAAILTSLVRVEPHSSTLSLLLSSNFAPLRWMRQLIWLRRVRVMQPLACCVRVSPPSLPSSLTGTFSLPSPCDIWNASQLHA